MNFALTPDLLLACRVTKNPKPFDAAPPALQYADRFKMARRHLDTALLLKAAYSGRGAQPGVPKLIVVLREPRDRLLSAFLEYEHYRIRLV